MGKSKTEIPVEVIRDGAKNPPLRRIKPNGTLTVTLGAAKIIEALRENKRVVIDSGSCGEWMQLQNFCKSDGTLTVVAQVYNAFSEECFYGAEPKFANAKTGEEMSEAEYKAILENAAKFRRERAGRLHATPRKYVECPSCGAEINLVGLGYQGVI